LEQDRFDAAVVVPFIEHHLGETQVRPALDRRREHAVIATGREHEERSHQPGRTHEPCTVRHVEKPYTVRRVGGEPRDRGFLKVPAGLGRCYSHQRSLVSAAGTPAPPIFTYINNCSPDEVLERAVTPR